MKIKTEVAQELYEAGKGGYHKDGWTWIAEEEGDDRRWSRLNTVILRAPDGEYWAFDYDKPLTENSGDYEKMPWDVYGKPDLEEIELYHVYARTKIVTEYVRLLT